MPIQTVEMLYDGPPAFDATGIAARAAEIRSGEITGAATDDAELQISAALFSHLDAMVQYDEGEAPAQTALLAASRTSEAAAYTESIQQSADREWAEEACNRSSATLLLSEMLARTLSPQRRVELFHSVLQAAVELTSPIALVFLHSQEVVKPEDYLADPSVPPIMRPGGINVRFFNIADTEGDMLMDTRGMDEIGLPDMQCHFRELDPNAVWRVLYNTAVYVFENGPVIESGHTVAGIEMDSAWVGRYESALVSPEREVLDLNPGPPYAAGERGV